MILSPLPNRRGTRWTSSQASAALNSKSASARSWTSTSIPPRRSTSASCANPATPTPAADHGGAQDARPRGRPVEHVPARRHARRGAVEQRLRAAGGDPRTLAHRLGGLQLLGAGHRQHGGAVPLRHPRAEGTLAGAAARRRDPLGVRHDRARGRLLGRHQHRVAHRARRRRLRAQRAQVVDLQRLSPQLPDHDRDGQDERRGPATQAAEPDPRAARHPRRRPRAQRSRVRLSRPRGACRSRCSRTCACRPPT